MNSRKLFAGVDGGGTRCRVRIRDEAGALIGEAEAGPANARLGLARVFGEVEKACEAALISGGLDRSAFGSLHLGLGLAGLDLQSHREAVNNHPHPYASVVAQTDAVAACLGAHGGGDGGILIFGTGSVGLARVGGGSRRVGGWGFEISDQGSGAILGRRALRLALFAAEGGHPQSRLGESLMARFDNDPEKMVIWAERAEPHDYAAFVPEVFAACEVGDPQGQALVGQAAAEAESLAQALLRLGAERLCLLGGLAGCLENYLSPEICSHLVSPKADALEGAILLAREAAGLGAEPRNK